MDLDDRRWSELTGGYRLPYDPRPAILNLDSEKRTESWNELWEELYHQSDVGPASYAAVPLLVRRQGRVRSGEWQTYALVGAIELARTLPHNPPLPNWLENDYTTALAELGRLALVELSEASTEEQVQSMLGVIALWKDDRACAQLLLEFTSDEIEELIELYRER